MRILYSFPHALGRPGIGSTAYHQVQGALRHGIAVLLYCTSLERELEGDVEVVETMRLGGRRVPHRALGVRRSYRRHDRIVARALRAGTARAHLVHGWPSGCLETFAAARALGIPTVREVPNTHTRHAFAAVARETERLGLAPVRGHSHTFAADVLALEEAEYRAADALLVPSEFVRRTFLEQGVHPDKLVLHRYGYEPERFPPGPDERRGRGGLHALFVGSGEPRKGLHLALEAWIASGAADRGRFVVCGGFLPGYREALGELIAHPGVELRPFTSDPGAVMRESDVFVFPSLEEGSAVVTYEARASGCVLAVSDAAGARSEHGRDGLVHRAGDIEELTEHLRRLHRDGDLLARLRRASLAGAADLTWDAAAAEVAGAYRWLAARGASAAARVA